MTGEPVQPDVPEPEATQSSAEPAPPAAAPPSWAGPSQEEWRTIVGGMQHLAERGLFDEPRQKEEEPDYDNMDLGDAISHYMDGRLGEFQPIMEAAAVREGRDQMGRIFDEVEKMQDVGKFDRGLAERLAHSFFAEMGGDPRYAQSATIAAGKEAARIQQEYGSKAVEEFKKSLKRGPGSGEEPAVGTGSSPEWSPEGKSMDEIIEHWAGQEEVG